MATEPERPTNEAPRTPERAALAEADRAFRVGDHARVRELANPLVDHPDGSVARDAVAILTKISADPAQIIVLALSFGLFLYVVIRYIV